MNTIDNFDKKTNLFRYIKYHPELKRIFGSQEAAIIFEQLEYWSSKYCQGFWKFFEPCDRHPLYRHGDSWQEELGFSRKVFARVFSVIGVHYKSKSDYLHQSDPFQGKLYASYYDRKTNRTYFLRNHARVKEFLSSFWQGVKNLGTHLKNKITPTGSSRNGPTGSSFVRASKDLSLQTSTSSSPPPDDFPQPPSPTPEEEQGKNIKGAQEMLEIWNQITCYKQTLRSDLKTSLPQALQDSFQGSLELWTDYCITVASSKFLMGEAPNTRFKAHLAWLIKPETIQNIRDQYYSLGDRPVHYSRPQPAETFNPEELQGSETWKAVCQHLCQKLGYHTFKSWFQEVRFLKEDTAHPILHCQTPFRRDWIRTHYQSELEAGVKKVLPHTHGLEICL